MLLIWLLSNRDWWIPRAITNKSKERKKPNSQGDEHGLKHLGMRTHPRTEAQKLISKPAVAGATIEPHFHIDYNQGEVMLGPLT